MQKQKAKIVRFKWQHQLINWCSRLNIKGARRLSVLLQKILIPQPKSTERIVLETKQSFLLEIDPIKDNGVERTLYFTGTYEDGVVSYMSQVLKSGDSFVDAGANIGFISLHAQKCVGEKGSITAFEAHPDTYQILKRNCELNNFNSIDLQQVALGNTHGSIKIFDNWSINRGGASVVINSDNSEGIDVQLVKMDDYSLSPKMIKVDVEGYELEVLKGAKQTIQKFLPELILEISQDRNQPYELEELVDFITSLGPYEFYKFKGGKERKSKLVKINNQSEFPTHDNVIVKIKN